MICGNKTHKPISNDVLSFHNLLNLIGDLDPGLRHCLTEQPTDIAGADQ
jgi:hypothetical protein